MAQIKDSGSNYQYFDYLRKAFPKRSVFDESYINSFSASLGVLYPIYKQFCVIGDSYKLSVNSVLNAINPPKVPLMSRQRVFFHFYYVRFSQIWKYAQIFFTHGFQNITLAGKTAEQALNETVPVIPLEDIRKGSLADFLGFDYSDTPTTVTSGTEYYMPAAKFMCYIKIWRDYYVNKRILSTYLKNKVDTSTGDEQAKWEAIFNFLFPADDSDFRIGTSQWTALVGNRAALNELFNLKYRDFVDDYFTTAQLSPMNEQEPEVPLNIKFEAADNLPQSTETNYVSPVGLLRSGSSGYEKNYLVADVPVDMGSDTPGISPYYVSSEGGVVKRVDARNTINYKTSGVKDNTIINRFANAFNNSVKYYVSGLTVEAVRQAESATLILEKMAHTDGSYREWARVMFGVTPSTSLDYRPQYIGGTYQPIIYSQVVNTAANQGEISGRGVSSAAGTIGSVFCDDMGYIIGIMSIMPDTYYSQGWHRTDLYKTSEDFYLPDRAKLGMQPIYNGELFMKPCPSTYGGLPVDQTLDQQNASIFGYINRFDELRYCANEVHGNVADPTKADWYNYIQQRYFASLPTLSPSFINSENNISLDYLTSTTEHPFIVQIANRARGVRCLPYRATPATGGIA